MAVKNKFPNPSSILEHAQRYAESRNFKVGNLTSIISAYDAAVEDGTKPIPALKQTLEKLSIAEP